MKLFASKTDVQVFSKSFSQKIEDESFCERPGDTTIMAMIDPYVFEIS